MSKLRITLYSTSDSIRSAIRKAFEGAGYELLEVTDATKGPRTNVNEEQQAGTIGRLVLPDRVDAIVSTSTPNRHVEGLAASMGLKQGRNDVFVVVLPEALNWLRGLLDKHGELVLVGADQAK